ncbi:molybdopterin converting factor subunit 1 [Sneathiella sp. CAU 1612]|jgi:molybdopterin synthase sulfur carrier subunit|uniref:Molybdopterin synthase sulfur carrier subunit n=1 Tax=Sneathiella sedimenti TaxID=2816034 RepID=A0ABS3F3J4_9PROT|nr:molybdopterin converting factor subunit 1 [Sneathiella sedimenti]MBO0333073.1 molybdopterin converting factor subunit 1 [Sneathiella sedimenti]
MKILYFAWLKTKLQMTEETISWSEDCRDTDSLVRWMKTRGPAFAEVFSDLEVVRIAVNQEYITGNTTLGKEDEIAFFPPVTGG